MIANRHYTMHISWYFVRYIFIMLYFQVYYTMNIKNFYIEIQNYFQYFGHF